MQYIFVVTVWPFPMQYILVTTGLAIPRTMYQWQSNQPPTLTLAIRHSLHIFLAPKLDPIPIINISTESALLNEHALTAGSLYIDIINNQNSNILPSRGVNQFHDTHRDVRVVEKHFHCFDLFCEVGIFGLEGCGGCCEGCGL